MLAVFKKFLKRKDDGAAKIFGAARNEREALILLKGARSRDEKRREEVRREIGKRVADEARLLEEGKAEKDDVRRLRLARQIKDLRHEIKTLEGKSRLYDGRIKTYSSHILALETVTEIKEEPLPDLRSVEEVGIKAKILMENLEELTGMADGIHSSREKLQADPEDQEILKEIEDLRQKDEEAKKAKEKPKEKTKKSAEPALAKKSMRRLEEEES